MEGFPSSVRGRISLSTKTIEHGRDLRQQTHLRDDMTRRKCGSDIENYDPNFNTLYQKGDVVVGGLNFWQRLESRAAATALKFKVFRA